MDIYAPHYSFVGIKKKGLKAKNKKKKDSHKQKEMYRQHNVMLIF